MGRKGQNLHAERDLACPPCLVFCVEELVKQKTVPNGCGNEGASELLVSLDQSSSMLLHSASHKDQRDANFLSARQFQAPDHRKWQDKDEKIWHEIHRSVGERCSDWYDTMAWNLGVPILDYRRTAKELSDEIAEEVAEDKEHDCPCPVSKSDAYTEEAKV